MSCDNDMKQQFELQLHEQYAINNNNKSSSLIALIATFLISATGYGYTLAALEDCRDDFKLVFVACITLLIVLTFLYTISVYLGSDQRMEQFIVYKIRNNYGGMKDVLPKGYTPYGKCFFKFVQGTYNYLSALFLCFIPLTAASYLYIVQDSKCVLVVSASAFCVLFCISYKVYRFLKYKKRCSNY